MHGNSGIWSVYAAAIPGILADMRARISAGPVGELARAGYQVQEQNGGAMIRIAGPMLKDAGFWERYGYASTSKTTTAINAIRNDPGIDRALILLDTPGGSVDGLAELGDAVAALAAVKPVIAQVGGMAASAGYYAAAQATEIRAGRMDLVGSIGTRMTLWDVSQAFSEAGIRVIPIDTGPHKSAGEPGTVITEEQQAEFQRIVDGYFSDFAATVKRGRRMTDQQFEAVSDGRVWLAKDAHNMGLIDKIIPAQDTITEFFAPRGDKTASARARMRMQQQSAAIRGIS